MTANKKPKKKLPLKKESIRKGTIDDAQLDQAAGGAVVTPSPNGPLHK